MSYFDVIKSYFYHINIIIYCLRIRGYVQELSVTKEITLDYFPLGLLVLFRLIDK